MRLRTWTRAVAIASALALAGVPAPSLAIAPALLLLVKQLAKDAAKSILKDMLLSSLRDMGCKGIALANAFEAFDLRRAARGGSAAMPGGIAGLPGMGGMGGMPGMGGMSGMPELAGATSMPGPPSLAGVQTMLGGLGSGGVPPEIAAKMRSLMPGLDQAQPEGTEGAPASMLAGMQSALGRPLSPAETVATIDELAELGFLSKPMRAELKECMVVLPSSIVPLGMGMGMLRPILPELRDARAELHALTPEEQDEVAAAMVEQVRPLPADERAAYVEYLGTGFFPPRIAAAAKAALR